jgi:hypothetical protein
MAAAGRHRRAGWRRSSAARRKFATVVGTIDFDAKGNVASIDAFGWFVWTEGRYVVLDEGGRLSD